MEDGSTREETRECKDKESKAQDARHALFADDSRERVALLRRLSIVPCTRLSARIPLLFPGLRSVNARLYSSLLLLRCLCHSFPCIPCPLTRRPCVVSAPDLSQTKLKQQALNTESIAVIIRRPKSIGQVL